MKTSAVLLLAFAAALSLPVAARAGSKPHVHAHSAKMAAAQTYACPICHHQVNVAKAKSLHYVCPVDGGKLAPVKTASLHKMR